MVGLTNQIMNKLSETCLEWRRGVITVWPGVTFLPDPCPVELLKFAKSGEGPYNSLRLQALSHLRIY